MGTAFSQFNSADGSADTSYGAHRWGGARPGAGRKRKHGADEHTHRDSPQQRRRVTDDAGALAQRLAADHNILANHNGQSWSEGAARMLLTTMIGLIVHDNMTLTDAVTLLTKVTRVGNKGLYRLYHEWIDHGEVYVHHDDRGAAAPTHIDHEHGVTAELCRKDIEHCHKWLNTWIEDDQYFRGSIGNLVSALVAAPVDIADDIDDEMEQQNLEATSDDIDAGQSGYS
jgi:hypothetical protein